MSEYNFTASEISDVFAIEAATSYFAARYLYFGGISLMNRAGFLAHSAIEQYLKAIICKYDPTQAQNISKKLHHLNRLLVEVHRLTKDNIFNSIIIKETIEHFDVFDQVGRYGANAKFDPLSKSEGEILTKGVSIMNHDDIKQLDYIISICRKFVTIKTIHLDIVAQIKAKNSKSSIWLNWNLSEITPDDILKYDNNYYEAL